MKYAKYTKMNEAVYVVLGGCKCGSRLRMLDLGLINLGVLIVDDTPKIEVQTLSAFVEPKVIREFIEPPRKIVRPPCPKKILPTRCR